MRKGVNGLSLLIQNVMQNDPFSKSLFLFCNGQRKLLKIVYWDRNGFCLWQKRLERNKFPLSKSPDAQQILYLIKDLFELESLRTDFSQKGFNKQRVNRAGPILESLFGLLTTHEALTPPNNSAENAIRQFVIGRKNWLFSDTERGAES